VAFSRIVRTGNACQQLAYSEQFKRLQLARTKMLIFPAQNLALPTSARQRRSPMGDRRRLGELHERSALRNISTAS